MNRSIKNHGGGAPDLLKALQDIIDSVDEGNAAIRDSLVIAAREALNKTNGLTD